jgi:hypothetical protein
MTDKRVLDQLGSPGLARLRDVYRRLCRTVWGLPAPEVHVEGGDYGSTTALEWSDQKHQLVVELYRPGLNNAYPEILISCMERPPGRFRRLDGNLTEVERILRKMYPSVRKIGDPSVSCSGGNG